METSSVNLNVEFLRNNRTIFFLLKSTTFFDELNILWQFKDSDKTKNFDAFNIIQ